MAWTHDLGDPVVDADWREVTFSKDVAAYVCHHIRNALQMAQIRPDLANARLLKLAETIEARVRRDGGN